MRFTMDKPRPVPFSLRARAAEERLEDLIHVGRCDARAGILNLQDRHVVVSINSDIDSFRPGACAGRNGENMHGNN